MSANTMLRIFLLRKYSRLSTFRSQSFLFSKINSYDFTVLSTFRDCWIHFQIQNNQIQRYCVHTKIATHLPRWGLDTVQTTLDRACICSIIIMCINPSIYTRNILLRLRTSILWKRSLYVQREHINIKIRLQVSLLLSIV